jgi:hypothetical protein
MIVCLVCWNIFLKPATPKSTHPELSPPTALSVAQNGRNNVDDEVASPRERVASIPRTSRLPRGEGANPIPATLVDIAKEKNAPIAAALASPTAISRETHQSTDAKPNVSKSPPSPQSDLAALPLEDLIAKVGDGVV